MTIELIYETPFITWSAPISDQYRYVQIVQAYDYSSDDPTAVLWNAEDRSDAVRVPMRIKSRVMAHQ